MDTLAALQEVAKPKLQLHKIATAE